MTVGVRIRKLSEYVIVARGDVLEATLYENRLSSKDLRHLAHMSTRKLRVYGRGTVTSSNTNRLY